MLRALSLSPSCMSLFSAGLLHPSRTGVPRRSVGLRARPPALPAVPPPPPSFLIRSGLGRRPAPAPPEAPPGWRLGQLSVAICVAIEAVFIVVQVERMIRAMGAAVYVDDGSEAQEAAVGAHTLVVELLQVGLRLGLSHNPLLEHGFEDVTLAREHQIDHLRQPQILQDAGACLGDALQVRKRVRFVHLAHLVQALELLLDDGMADDDLLRLVRLNLLVGQHHVVRGCAPARHAARLARGAGIEAAVKAWYGRGGAVRGVGGDLAQSRHARGGSLPDGLEVALHRRCRVAGSGGGAVGGFRKACDRCTRWRLSGKVDVSMVRHARVPRQRLEVHLGLSARIQ
mmetsp:Transcript_2111/g.6187  ORF Transcript_2111/g.6187 Transcript_2111/m.6187 type:complete len:342 (-) Transcript_2111:214-1239(-)